MTTKRLRVVVASVIATLITVVFPTGSLDGFLAVVAILTAIDGVDVLVALTIRK